MQSLLTTRMRKRSVGHGLAVALPITKKGGIMRMVKAVIGSSALVMLMLASPAIGEQSRTHTLRGDFAFTGSTVCVNSGANFATTPPTPPLGFVNLVPIGPSFVNTNSVQGILTFNGDGTGTGVQHFVSLGNPGAASVFDVSLQFTYSVAADGTLTIDNGPAVSNTVAGPNAGQQSIITDVPTFIGRLSSDRKSLTFATFAPAVETVTRVVPAPELVTTLRICHRNRIGIRIGKDPRSGWQGED